MTPTPPNGEPQNGQLAPARVEAPPHAHSPQESLGLTASNGLFKASIQAGIGFALLLAGLTFGPYFWDKSQGAAKANAPAPAKSDSPAVSQPPPAPPPSAPEPKAPSGAPTAVGKPPGKSGDILDKLGESGTKTAPAKVNPLDKKDDDILKDIK
jgi:hypothetical protein